jgi:hypothetical protein
MGRLVHTGLGSSSLVAHVLPYPPPPHVNSFVLGPAVINTHTPVPRIPIGWMGVDDVTLERRGLLWCKSCSVRTKSVDFVHAP